MSWQSAVLSLRAESATSTDLPVVSAVVPVDPVSPVEYGEYIGAMRRERAGTANSADGTTLSRAHSLGVQTPGGICRPDSRGMLQVKAAGELAFQAVELAPVEYEEYVSALQRHRARAPAT